MRMLTITVAAIAVATSAWAIELATSAQIQSAISDKTVQGSMEASGAYTEYYAADGTIRGEGYTGSWYVEADTMCFKYGEDPADCWGVSIDGESVAWVKEGKAEGTGTIVSGNPNNF
ncbi:MAG: hypothetical protein AAGC81_10305 [Pseudomonadota bacterium]